MRPKGWKLDPKWIAHYEAQDKARMDREMARIKFEMQQLQWKMESEEIMKRPKLKIMGMDANV